ncbi:TonB-dependent receptor [Tenacibaculum sp. Bg11-29]|uniref:carboxypeptidase-like regulatory domain-containing protein n=1 Tax=Tenacibaculum sp. Bg11-29 TaxID=2058306 RepID=UPI000C338517|nr:carboxypeptidase-like regulatory domain-containing protein [Tenacibaculum sp. Bg11-29]PKH50545.1 TonB-dependent receptor [Tenacibaculum sp. Bg11-29]
MKNTLLIVFLLTTWITNAQITLKGVVKDSIGVPLEMANAIAINTVTKKLDSYGFTDSKGNFKLNLKKNATYSIKMSYIGFRTSDVIVKTGEIDIIKNISLKKDDSLDEVNITYKMPVTIKGDTIVYNADSFKNGTEKKLGDILENLPGVEVNDDGEIEVEGKAVKKIMVEGKDFFDGDTKIATKNIPADAIDKIQVLKNHSEVGQMSSVTDNEDNIVINIKLKEGKKNFWFGEVTAGLGVGMTNNRYIVTPKLFYYNPKYSVNIITDINDIGEVSFTRRDYFKFTGGVRGLSESNGTNFNVGSSDISFLTMKNNRAKEIESKFGAANFSYSPKKTWDLSGFAIYSGNETDMEEATNRVYSNAGIDKNNLPAYDVNNPSSVKYIDTEKTQNTTNQISDLGLFKISLSYKPNSNNQFDYDVFAKISKQKQFQNTLSSRTYLNATDEIVPINQISEQSPFSINQNLKYYYTLNEKNIFAFEALHLWQDEDPFYNAELEKLSFANLIGADVNASPYNLGQNKRIKTNKFDAKLDYFYVINPKSNLNITLGTTQSNQQFNSDIFEILGGNKSIIAQPSTINNVDFTFRDVYAGLHYKFITGVFTFNQGFTVHNYVSKNTQLGSELKNSFTKILPDASIKISLKKSETLRLTYSMQTSFTDVNQLAEGYVFNNYNSLYSGNRELENSLYHNVNLNYFSFNMFNYTNVYGIINYSKRTDVIKSNTQFIDVNSVRTSVNSAFPDETISVRANFQKSFRKFKVRVGANVSLSKANSLISNRQTNVVSNRLTKTFSQSYTSKFSTNFKKSPNFDVGYNVSINNSDIGGIKNTFTTHSPYANLDIFLLKEFIFTSKYTFNKVVNQGETIDEYGFLRADLTYQKKDSKWEYKLSATNLLNSNGLNQNSSNDIYVSNSTYAIQPRIAMFTVKYNL